VSTEATGDDNQAMPPLRASSLAKAFARDASKRDGLKSWCKTCDAERARAYYEANREQVLQRAAARHGRTATQSVGRYRPRVGVSLGLPRGKGAFESLPPVTTVAEIFGRTAWSGPIKVDCRRLSLIRARTAGDI